MRTNTVGWVMAAVLAVAGGTALADAFVDAVRARCEAALLLARDAGGVGEAYESARATADTAAAYASVRQLEAIAWGEATQRLIGFLEDSDGLGALGGQPGLCLELGLLLADGDDYAAAIRLGSRLSEKHAADVAGYPALAAAVCVVHERGYRRRINENTVHAPDPVEVFDYFVRNAKRLRLDPARTPALLLVHVVDVTEPIEQLEWALATYGGRPEPGDRFFEIEYDVAHYRTGATKKVTEAGDYCIGSIKEHGGVCADQAYFAESVGKACGIPTAYVVARGADVGHAWIGYLDERRGRWNFDAGRYEAYQRLRGTVRSAQTGLQISDADAGVLGGLLGSRPEQVHATMGVRWAVARMSGSGVGRRAKPWGGGDPFDDSAAMKGTLRTARDGSIGDRLALLKTAMARCATVPAAWEAVGEFAQLDQLDTKAMDEWARAVERMCGKVYPDFSFDVMKDLIGSVDGVRDRQRMWEWAFGRYRSRPDLASAVRFEQGAMFDKDGQAANAWAAYEDVVKTFLDDGPMSVSALRAMAAMLDKNGKSAEIIPYLEDAARRATPPSQMAAQFARQSNYYKIHVMLVHALEQAGRSGEARRVRERLGIRGG